MACQCGPAFNDSEWDLLAKILTVICEGGGTPGSGDVTGPDGATSGNIAIFSGASGKVISDSGVAISSLTTGLQSERQAIGAGVDMVAVVFPTPFAAVPTVVASISRPAAEDLIPFNIDEASITVNGFTASLGATTGSANYKFNWLAH